MHKRIVGDLLSHSDAHKTMGLDGFHPKVMKELAASVLGAYIQIRVLDRETSLVNN